MPLGEYDQAADLLGIECAGAGGGHLADADPHTATCKALSVFDKECRLLNSEFNPDGAQFGGPLVRAGS